MATRPETDEPQPRICRGRIRRNLWSTSMLGAPVHLIDTESSRFTGESVAGLVVGAMGVFVFALYLRQWLKERRAREEAEATST